MPCFIIPIHEHGDPDRPGPYPHGKGAAEWKPAMSKADAAEWAKDSAWTKTVYHFTHASNIPSIVQTGLDPSKEGFGENFGPAIYTATDHQTALFYQREFSGELRRLVPLNLKVRVHKIARVRFNDDDPPAAEIIVTDLGLLREYRRQFKLLGRDEGKALIRTLQGAGYDALLIKSSVVGNPEVGGNQLLVFDKKNITVIRPRRALGG